MFHINNEPCLVKQRSVSSQDVKTKAMSCSVTSLSDVPNIYHVWVVSNNIKTQIRSTICKSSLRLILYRFCHNSVKFASAKNYSVSKKAKSRAHIFYHQIGDLCCKFHLLGWNESQTVTMKVVLFSHILVSKHQIYSKINFIIENIVLTSGWN